MARETRPRSGRVSKFGMCVNEECEKYKEVQEITHGDFVCEKCQKPLTSCPPPADKRGKGKMIGIIAAIVGVAAIIGGIISFSGGKSDEQPPVTDTIAAIDSTKAEPVAKKDTVVITDTLVQRDTIVHRDTVKVNIPAKGKTTVSSKSSGTIRLSYGTYVGESKNGKPDGMGRLTYKTSRQIDSRDPKGRIAEVGDYVIGEYSEGRLVHGTWYGSDGVVKGSVLIGK